MRHKAQPTNPYRVLVADYDAQSRSFITKLLEYYSIEVVEVAAGVDACNAVLKDNKGFDLVIMDIKMPIIDGIEFMYVLDRALGGRRPPVILQLPYQDDNLMMQAITAGAVFCLPKPYSQRMLFTQTKAALKRCNKNNAYYSKPGLNVEAEGTMLFRSFAECDAIIESLANISSQAIRLRLGLRELMYNAIEHGHLKIAPKERAAKKHSVSEETSERKIAKTNTHQPATLRYKITPYTTEVTIIDEGDGFNWKHFDVQNDIVHHSSSKRGIYIARHLAFDSLEYNDKGNEVKGRLVSGSK
ncbi:MAG: response regulator [Proteobacteria bacterium]|nr:response regulator [Pseudomonadota bacterium]